MKIKSVIDVGCGTGTWLKVFEEFGVLDFLGVDSNEVDRQQLNIPAERFVAADLSQPFRANRKFDLVVSLEVAEHLPAAVADVFVDTLVSHGDAILFSAAIPGQGGQFHLNEQWPAYWEKKFNQHGYWFHDILRPHLWNQESVEWWYRQNIFLITKERPTNARILHLVHPELLKQIRSSHAHDLSSLTTGKQGLRVSASIFWRAIVYKVKSMVGKN